MLTRKYVGEITLASVEPVVGVGRGQVIRLLMPQELPQKKTSA